MGSIAHHYASDTVASIRVDEIATGPAGDRVACSVPGTHDVVTGTREQQVSSAATDEQVGAAARTEDVRPRRAAEDVAAPGPCSCDPDRSSRGGSRW